MSEQKNSTDDSTGVSNDNTHWVIDFIDNNFVLAFCILIFLLGAFSYVLSMADH